MLRIIGETHIDFLGRRKLAFYLSAGLLLLGVVALIVRGGPRYGIDFTGGSLVQIQFEDPITTEELRSSLDKIGYGRAEIQRLGVGREFLIRVPPGLVRRGEGSLGEQIKARVQVDRPQNPCEVVREEVVGPRIGKELQRDALIALILGMIGILGYVSLRFDFRFGVGAVIALCHDLLITFGILSLFGRELSIPVIAALLTIIGYSVNDSIVISDRIRENLKKLRGEDFEYIVNRGLNETLSRTIITSLTTFAAAFILLLVGAQAIQDFAFVLVVGVLVGTYSSIFILAPVVVEWEMRHPTRRHR